MEIPHPTVLMVKVGGNISSPSPTVVLLLMEELPAPPGDANLNSWNYLWAGVVLLVEVNMLSSKK